MVAFFHTCVYFPFLQEGTSVEFFCKNVVNTENQQSQPFVLLIGGSRWNPLQSFAIIEHRAVACPSILSAIDTVFKLIYVLDLNYQPQCMAVWQFLESLVYKLGNSVTVASILRFRNWMSQQWILLSSIGLGSLCSNESVAHQLHHVNQ